MITTEHFVFIHMHKTGGQTLSDVIQRCIPDHRNVGYHYPRTEIPADCRALPRVGMVRNPWDWYVSWYAFNNGPTIRSPLFAILSNRGQADFNTTIANLVNLGSDNPESVQHRDALVAVLPETLTANRGVGLTKNCIREFSANDTGYYSWLFNRMFGDDHDGQLHVGKFENLQHEFLEIMERLSVPETSKLRDELGKRERKNASRHSHYSHYYDETLRDLIARKDASLARTYDYHFEIIGPTGESSATGFEAPIGTGGTFQKCLGGGRNYLRLHDGFDIRSIEATLARIPREKWEESGREQRFDVHSDTRTLLCIHFDNYDYAKQQVHPIYEDLREDVEPIVAHIADFYQDNGFVASLIFAKLLPGGKIPRHADGGYSLMKVHRIHIPIVTNEQNIFFVNGEEKNMRTGEVWEINNALIHMVENRSDQERIHLIIDWMPNQDGQSHAELFVPEKSGHDAQGQQRDSEAVSRMLAEAFQLHRSRTASEPDLRRAESMYRHVLNFHSRHVVANNLLGLLYIQTRRFDEAVHFIKAALAEKIDDPQAHANLGLALKDLGRFEEAADHFQKALSYSPSNPVLLNNLGNVYKELGRTNEAIINYRQALSIQPSNAEIRHNLSALMQQVETNQ